MLGSKRGKGRESGGGGKRLTIKLSKAKPSLPADFLDSSWSELEEAVRAIHSARAVVSSREELYHKVEDLCMHKKGLEVLRRLEKVLDEEMERSMKQLVGQTPDHIAFLTLVTEIWEKHCQQMHSIRNLFLYLDRSFIINEPSKRSLWDMGLAMFRKYLQAAPDVEKKVVTGFLQLIERERNGEAVNHLICTSVVRMLVGLQLYEEAFEAVFLKETNDFYKQESVRLLDQSPVPDYLIHVEKRLREEKQRVTRYLDPQTRGPLVRACEKELVASHVAFLLEKGFESMMDAHRTEDLARMYSLFSRVDALKEMRASLAEFVKRRGVQIVQSEGEEKEVVPKLLKLKQDLDALLKHAMCGNEDFDRAIRDSFENFINAGGNKTAELIAKFIDLQLRSGAKGVGGEEETEELLEKVVVLFRFLSAKDVFEAFYKKDLAKRLLLGKSASNDLERSMIAKLKTECGSNFTNKLEGMFKDIELSKDLMTMFKQSPQYSERPGEVEMNVFVLTTGFWPPYPMMKDLKLHDMMTKCQSLFESFYFSKHEGRRLAWQHSLGTCLLRASMPCGRKELQVSLYQSLVLLLFNACSAESDELSYTYIKQETGIEEGELRRTLQSLACGKVRVLTKEPKGREVEDQDKFVINAEFQSKQYRLKINSIQMKETSSENKQTHERVFQDRQYQIDAAIVRIMKARKSLTHALLMAELFKQLRFQAKPADLKRRIESLIEREYIERDEADTNIYKYLA